MNTLWRQVVNVLLLSMICGCGYSNVNQEQFMQRVFGSSFPGDLSVNVVTKKAVGGTAVIARVTGDSKKIKQVLESQGVAFRDQDDDPEILELLRLRIKGISPEAVETLITKNETNKMYSLYPFETNSETREFYIAKDCSVFFLIFIKD